jgi:hypothetical protein
MGTKLCCEPIGGNINIIITKKKYDVRLHWSYDV